MGFVGDSTKAVMSELGEPQRGRKPILGAPKQVTLWAFGGWRAEAGFAGPSSPILLCLE